MNKQPLAIIGTAAEKGGENKSKLCPPEIHTRTDQGTKSLLKTGMRSGSQKAYREALLLEKYRDALLEQANELRSDIQSDISQKAKNIAPRIFGWNNTEISGLNSKLARRAKDINGDYENIWETLIGLESHEYRLEDPDVAAGFFSELQNNFLRQDLKNVDSRFISKYAWLKTSKSESLIDLPVKAPKKSISTPSRSLLTSKKTSSQQRLEKELVMQEIALKNALNNKFKPISIPDSSIIPKYDKIMENQSTRSTKIRELLLKRRMEERCKAETIERDLQKQLRKPLGSYTYVHSSTSRRLNSTERREAVLKEIMKECTFSPIVSSKIPNFKREHQKFKGALEKGKSQRSTTIPQPFQLSARLPAPTKKETIEDSTSSRKNAKNLTDCESKLVAKSTKTEELKIKHRQDEKDAEALIDEYKRELQEIAESKKVAIAERLRVILDSTSKSAKERLIKTKVRDKLKCQKETEKSYQSRINEMKERLDSRKCLFERFELDAARIRANQQIKDILACAW